MLYDGSMSLMLHFCFICLSIISIHILSMLKACFRSLFVIVQILNS